MATVMSVDTCHRISSVAWVATRIPTVAWIAKRIPMVAWIAIRVPRTFSAA